MKYKPFNKELAKEWLAWRERYGEYTGGDIECGQEDMEEVLIPAVLIALGK